MFKTKYGYSGFIAINKAYNEYIRDPYHTHLNATKWASLTEFAQDMEKEGIMELAKEVDGTGTEQIMIKLINREKKETTKGETKEEKRENERKREEKEIQRVMRDVAKAQRQVDKDKHNVGEAKQIGGAGIIQFDTITSVDETQ